jgi:hypothetical protein
MADVFTSVDRSRILTIRSHKSLRVLELWLAEKDYNNVFPFLEDRRGQRMIGLNWLNPDGTYEKRGLVIVTDLDVLPDAVDVCNKGRKNGA